MLIHRIPLLLALCLGGAAFAQFEGLDLTGETPDAEKKQPKDTEAPDEEGGMGLDLGGEGLDLTAAEAPTAPPELRPSIAILGVVAGDDDKVTQGRADLLSTEVVQLAGTGDRFSSVSDPQLVQQQLGADGTAKALACDGWACFDEVAKKLKVHRLFLVVVTKSGAGSTLTMKGFDPGINEVLGAQQDSQEKAERSFAGFAGKSQAKKDKAFLKKMTPYIGSALTKLATANGKIVLDNVEASSVVTIDGLAAGTGSVEAVVQRGRHVVKVTAAGYLPFEQEVTVDPLQTQTVRVSLVARPLDKPIAVEKPVTPSGPPLLKRPGLYVAAGGVALAAVGAILGAMAKGVEAKAVDTNGDGIVEVSRRDLKAAQGQAMAANVLMGAGGAVAAGGVVWIFVTPAEKASVAEPTEGGGFGVHVGVGGTF